MTQREAQRREAGCFRHAVRESEGRAFSFMQQPCDMRRIGPVVAMIAVLTALPVFAQHETHTVTLPETLKWVEPPVLPGARLAVVLGDPRYYRRFGFSRALRHGLRNEYGVDEEFMALGLEPGALARVSGLVRYAREFGAVTAG